jgi:tetratricopeptide (TPR) repeat protein
MAAQAKNSMPRCGMRWAGALRRGPWRAGCALVLTLSPAAAGASTAERVFAAVSPSVVVVRAANNQGSGVVVAPQVVATNCHVLGGPAQTTVQHGRSSHTATRLWGDQQRDLCLLQVPTLEAPPVTLGEAGRLRVGATVYAIGAPQGLELSLSAGLVSQLRGAEGAPLVQTTAPISPGSSGGGLFDERGRLVGLTTFQMERGQNVNFALPAEWVAAALARASSWLRCRTAPTVACLLAEAREIAGELGLGGYSAILAHATIAAAQAQAGDQQGAAQRFALASVAAFSIENAAWRARALSGIAEAQAQADDRQGAAQTFAQALATARSIEHADPRARALRAIAEAQARAGDIAGALTTARSIEDAIRRAPALAAIAQAQAQAGDRQGAAQTFAQALATARGIPHSYARAAARGDIAAAQAQTGDRQGAAQTFAQALATARSLEDADQRAPALAAIAQAQARAGDRQGAAQTFAQALATARGIADTWERTQALANIAQAQAQADDRQGAAQTVAQALAAARRIEDSRWRGMALYDIAVAQAQAGDVAGARATAHSIEPSRRRDSTLGTIAVVQAEVADAQAQAADTQAQAGDITGAVTTIDEILSPPQRARALARVAGHLAQRR